MATMNSGLGGTQGYGESSFKGNGVDTGNLDDGAVFVDTSSVFGDGMDFFGSNFSGLYINSNGLITFEGPNTAYFPDGITALDEPAIVPFWLDVDITKGGDIFWDIDPANGTVTITWLDVAPFIGSGGNSFQVVLTDTGNGGFDINFVYEDMQWADIDPGGGDPKIPATVGITDGGSSVFELTGSGDSSLIEDYEALDFGTGGPTGVYSLMIEGGLPIIGAVLGSSGDDVMVLGFADLDGNSVTTGDDLIDGEEGNDFIDGNAGNDTIEGGAGNDTILGGISSAPSYTDVGNGNNQTGTTGTDNFRWLAENGSNSTIWLDDNTGGDSTGDGAADLVLVATTNNTGTLALRGFDYGTDRVILQESYTNISWNVVNHGGGNYAFQATVTYANGNTQNFNLELNGIPPITPQNIFTTDIPSIGDDSLSGGDDGDTFLVDDDFGSDTIVGGEGVTSGTDTDLIDVSALADNVTITASGDEAGILTDGSDTLSFSEIEQFTLTDGNDSYWGEQNDADTTVDAGLGNDYVRSGDGADSLIGGIGNDTLSSDLGADTLLGGDGADVLAGGSGDDSLTGGAGNDVLRGDNTWINVAEYSSVGGSATTLTVTNGADGPIQLWWIDGSGALHYYQTIPAGVTSSQLTYESDNWVLRDENGFYLQLIEGGNQTLTYGADGLDDTLSGGGGNDTIYGEFGNDSIDGGLGADSIWGGTGSDTITGGNGADFIDAGKDADRILIEDGFGADTIVGGEDVSTGADQDTLDFSGMTTGIDVTYSGDEAGTASDGTDTLGFSQIEALTLSDQDDNVDATLATSGISVDGAGGNDTLLGGTAGDTLAGGDGDDYIDGGDGDDFLTTGLGQDTLIGGAGNDTLMNSAGDDSLVGGTGNDSIVATEGSDTLEGGDGDDTLFGGADDDRLVGGAGADSMDGGDDADTFVIEDGFGNDTIVGGEGVTSTSDSDTLSAITTGAISVVLSGDEAGTLTDGVDTILFSEIENIFAGSGDDLIDAFNDAAGLGLFGFGGNDTIQGGTGDDYIEGGDGNDFLFGWYGADTIFGGSGDDTIQGNWGDDSIDGGAGSDRFEISQAADTDTITGGDEGGDIDTIDFVGSTPVNVTFTGNEAGSYDFGTGAAGGTFTEIEAIEGSDSSDTIDASSTTSGMSLHGEGGNDTVTGGSGADTISGGGGNDSLLGGAGADSLNGGSGNDYLSAGGGGAVPVGTTLNDGDAKSGDSTANAFVWDTDGDAVTQVVLGGAGSGTGDGAVDTIYVADTDNGGELRLFQFDEGVDKVFLSEVPTSITRSGGIANRDDFTVTYANGNVQTFRFYHDSGTITDPYQFFSAIPWVGSGDTLVGGTGSDTLEGGSAADSMSGGDDADTFVIVDGFGADTITGGEGTSTGTDQDTIDFSAVTTGIDVTYSGDEAGTATDGADTLGFSQIEGLTLTDQNDIVNGTAATSGISVDGAAGNDTLLGGSGDDTLAGGDGDDYIDGGDGNDFLTTGLGQDTLFGGEGNDTLMNSDGDDSLDGGAGDDSLVATGGEDTLRGGTGDDYMDGGDDADTFIIEDGFGNDTIIGGEGTTDGSDTDHDTIDLSALSGPVTVTYTGDESGTITDGTDTITFSEIEHLILTDQSDYVDATITHDGQIGDSPGVVIDARDGDDTVLGGRGGDTIDGGDGDDYIDGGYGDDSLVGGAGNDTLIATDNGNDTMEGGEGNDYIDGGTQADTLSGGSGEDTIIGGTGDDYIDGGDDDDSLTGGEGDDVFVVSTGSDTISDFNFGNTGALGDGDTTNNDFIDLSGYYDSLSELRADFDDDGVLNQSNSTDNGGDVDYSNNDAFGNGDGLTFEGASRESFTADNTGVVCFTSGTAILTLRGELPVEALRPGDLIVTRDNGPQPLLWSGMRRIDSAELDSAPHLRPVELAAGAFGNARPLVVSPQHGILLDLDGEQYLTRAIHLARLKGGKVRQQMGCRSVTYWHLFFERHQIVFSNGLPSESFFPGPQAIGSLHRDARREMAALMPDFAVIDTVATASRVYGASTRPYSRTSILPDHVRAFAAVG